MIVRKVNLSKINKLDIWRFEEEAERIVKEISGRYKSLFEKYFFKLHISLKRVDENPKYFPICPAMSNEECLKPHYHSFISMYLLDQNDNLINGDGDEDDDTFVLDIWWVERSFFFFVVDNFFLGTNKGYKTMLSPKQIREKLENRILLLVKNFNLC
jgi:hypothetical protein